MREKAILLAAGRSLRLGRDKPSIELRGETLVERHCRQLRGIGVEDLTVVCNPENIYTIRERTNIRTVLQRGTGMSAAILTGLEFAGAAETTWLVCVNDIIDDEGYGRVAFFPEGGRTLVLATRKLERTFSGGCLSVAESGAVRGIVEKPAGGCPAGSMANIMIHRLCGADVAESIAGLLRGASVDDHAGHSAQQGLEYEPAINALIERGLKVCAVPVDYWTAIKTAEDLASVESAMRRSEVA